MSFSKKDLLLYAVTDRAWVGKQTFIEQVECALKGGATCIQIREKHLDNKDFLNEALQVKALCRQYNVPFIVNDNAEVALKCGADGIHVGQHDMDAADVHALIVVYAIADVSAEFVGKQIDCIFTDIFPDSVKVGIVSNSEIIETIAEKLTQYNAGNIVVDPVMVSTSGCRLISENATKALEDKLIPIASVITPNIPEAEVLSGISIHNQSDMVNAAKIISQKYKGAILVKGGHLVNDATDLLYSDGNEYWFSSERINNPNTHGTGCTLSSAIACRLA